MDYFSANSWQESGYAGWVWLGRLPLVRVTADSRTWRGEGLGERLLFASGAMHIPGRMVLSGGVLYSCHACKVVGHIYAPGMNGAVPHGPPAPKLRVVRIRAVCGVVLGRPVLLHQGMAAPHFRLRPPLMSTISGYSSSTVSLASFRMRMPNPDRATTVVQPSLGPRCRRRRDRRIPPRSRCRTGRRGA